MSMYRKQPILKSQQERFNKIKHILDGPIIRGCKPIYNRAEKLQQTKPRNRFEEERELRKAESYYQWSLKHDRK